MSSVRKVLLADPDLSSARALTRALRQKGYQVYSARDGARALELAVLRHPDLVLFDRSCPVLEARTFVDILRTNPRTDTIPVVVTASAEEADEAMRDGPGALLRKPYNLDEVLAHIDDLLARAERARSEATEPQEIEGALAQLALPDLLQTLALARRTGRVTLRRGTERGEVELVEGRPVDARSGGAQGEKALFRLLSWVDGTFSFQAGPPATETRIERGTDELLLEGARQLDECRRLLETLSGAGARWIQAPVRPSAPFLRWRARCSPSWMRRGAFRSCSTPWRRPTSRCCRAWRCSTARGWSSRSTPTHRRHPSRSSPLPRRTPSAPGPSGGEVGREDRW